MRKDNYGICFTFYAVLAFVLAMLGYTTLVALLLGFVIVVHKDQWLTMQVMQAFFLSLISGLVSVIIDIIRPIYTIPIIGSIFSILFGIVTSVVFILVIIMAIMGIANVAKEQDANIPIIKVFADKAFGLAKNVVYTQSNPAQNAAPTQNDDSTHTLN